jgi:Uma2 family endonuclease
MSVRLLDPKMLLNALVEADENGYRLELISGLGVWEVQPAFRHVETSVKIERSIRPNPMSGKDCGCLAYPDLYIVFPDGSLKRPDISVFCRRPEEIDTAVTLLPEAVIEIVSKGSERKDLDINPPFYLGQGVKDVIIANPYDGAVYHYRRDGVKRLNSPVEISLECGCVLTA